VGTRNAVRAHRGEVEARVEAESLGKALIVEEQLRRELLSIEQTLRILEYEWQRNPPAFDFDAWSRQALIQDDVSLQLFMSDAQGVVRASTRRTLTGNNVAARDFFRHEAELRANEGKMFIGALTRGPETRRWEMNLVRRLDLQDGTFAGLIGAAYDTKSFARFLQQVDLGSGGLVGVVNAPTGDFWFQSVASDAGSVANITGSGLYMAMRSMPSGRWTGQSEIDGLRRIYAFAGVPNRELTVVVGLDRATAMQPAAEWEDGALIFASGITLLILLMAGLLLHEDWSARRRHAVLARERGVLEAALTGMTDGIMMVDAQLRLVEWNRHFPEFTGVPEEILEVGLPMREMLRAQAEGGEFGPVDVDAEVARRLALLDAGVAFGASERSRPNGRKLEVRRNPLPGGGFVTLYSDVTGRHQAEERLRQAQTLAAVGRLTSGVAHDFNNLLASISGNAEMLHRQLGEQSPHARRIAIILQAVNRGANLVRQLLAFSRKQALAPTKVDLNQVVSGIKELLAATLGRSINVVTMSDDRLWPALVDAAQVEHVILNLAINARDAMTDGGSLTISTGNASLTQDAQALGMAAGDYVFVAVTDTGTGMTNEVLRNAFEPFFTTKAPGHGSGLGLSQVYGVASQSGGGVQIDSIVGRGTTVKVFFPRADASVVTAPSPEVRTITANKADAGTRQEGKRTILLVDDEADCRETVSAMLSVAGMTVVVAEDSSAALRLLDQGLSFDLLLVDFAMPGMNGAELANAVRARMPAVPVVFFTGGDDEWISGERWVLAKPFLSRSLIDMLQAAFDDARQGDARRRAAATAL
jgi:signal transduction histidine kinase